MNVIEEKYLKNLISKLNRFVKENDDFLDFFNESNSLIKKPLQDLSFKSDINFLDEIAFIFSVISSIISHPHMLNKGEEVIIRSELAPNISNDMFQKTIRDSKLWSEDQFKMIPEYVYYYQQIDELRIYENIFIVCLIKKIEFELTKYNDFYISLIDSFDGQETLSLKKDNSDIALKKIQMLNRRLKHIKNTFFYKEVSKGYKKDIAIRPTNILVKDRLYNYCYKFYKKLITYSDTQAKLYDIRLYYYVKLLNALKDEGFTPSIDNYIEFDNNQINISNALFYNDNFKLSIIPVDLKIGLELIVENLRIKNKKANKSRHLLLFDSQASFKDNEYIYDDCYDSIEVMSLWNMAYVLDEVKVAYKNIYNESELILKWLKSKLMVVKASYDIYSSYCAICKKQNIEVDEANVITCESCNSKYVFTKNKENSNECIWFIKVRR